jgi:hypothetical protein
MSRRPSSASPHGLEGAAQLRHLARAQRGQRRPLRRRHGVRVARQPSDGQRDPVSEYPRETHGHGQRNQPGDRDLAVEAGDQELQVLGLLAHRQHADGAVAMPHRHRDVEDGGEGVGAVAAGGPRAVPVAQGLPHVAPL